MSRFASASARVPQRSQGPEASRGLQEALEAGGRAGHEDRGPRALWAAGGESLMQGLGLLAEVPHFWTHEKVPPASEHTNIAA